MNWISKTPIGHRGLHDQDHPENSLGAFEKAIEANYAIELDIRLTKDGKIIVFHDIDTERVVGQNVKIRETALEDLEKMSILKSKYTIPSLEKVLELVAGRVPLLIEIKNESSVGVLEDELIRILDSYKGIFAIQSFNPLSLKHISTKRPDYQIGLLVGSFKKSKISFLKKIVLKYMLLTPYLSPDFFSVEYGVDIWMQKAMMKIYKNKKIIYWTITSKEKAHQLLREGNGIIFEGFSFK